MRTKNKIIVIAMAVLMTVMLFLTVFVSPARAADRKTHVITFLASGTRTAATAQSTGFDVSAYIEGQILVNVTAESGVSTLDIIVETSDDNSTYYTHTAMAQITATGQYLQAITNFGKYVRLNYTVGGTSFTFAAVGVFKN
ncbi:hypothetical protein KKE60_07755 [Patescibacteria group bacterium]|nr:hypothetical protein [Patescibacteria group bacterium]